SDPLVRATFEAIAAYEQTLQEKHEKRSGLRGPAKKIAKKGVYQSLLEWSKLHGNRPGFHSLIEAGLPEFTFEAVVVRFADRFPPDAVTNWTWLFLKLLQNKSDCFAHFDAQNQQLRGRVRATPCLKIAGECWLATVGLRQGFNILDDPKDRLH